MKKIYAMLAGACMAILVIICFDNHMDSEIIEKKEAVRNHRSYERFWSREVQKMVMDENTLPIMGSSELLSLEDYSKNISNFLNSDDMNVMTIGAGHCQSLSHTMELGALSEGITSRKVALFLSPQWFTEEGITAEAFPQRFGEDTLLGFLENDKISDSNKEYVLNRTLALLENSPAQYERVERYKNSFKKPIGIDTIYTKLMKRFWRIRSEYQVYKQLPDMSLELPKINLSNINFSEMLKLAEEQGEAACTNNEFSIGDDYWNTYVKETYEQGEVKEKKQVFSESLEYDDLRCFLSVARELGIEVLLVHIPVNEKWSSYVGQLTDTYYENIREIAKEYDCVTLMDMTEYGSEMYFFKDAMHLGWKGWTRINEALYREFKK